MKTLSLSLSLFYSILLSSILNAQIVQEYVNLDGNNIRSFFINTGILDQNITQNNAPGYEWPKGMGTHAIFTAGLTIAAKINGQLRMAAASYEGEYAPGYSDNGQAFTNSNFKLYRVRFGDNQFTNPDYANWGMMVPYGAPYVDVNNNGIYEAAIDTPGVRGAIQTIFLCMTDGFASQHNSGEGFGGGTAPLYAEVHMTAWCYNTMGLEDVQFVKWDVINKSGSTWNGTILSLVTDPDLGSATDDWIGCDTSSNLGYCYNSDNTDGNGEPGTYGASPPAVGITFLKTPTNSSNKEFGLSSFTFFNNFSTPGAGCENGADSPIQAYNYMKGLKSDGTKWVNPLSMTTTKYCYTGNPETGVGWTESDGKIGNCGGDTTGSVVQSPGGDRRMVMSIADSLYNLSAGQQVTIAVSQQIARGSNNLNSVIKLKLLENTIRSFWQTIGISPISTEVPETFRLHQNYPNPFNPSTKIRFDVPGNKEFVKLIIYDISGREVAKLVNQELAPGVYEYDFNSGTLSSGMYFYKLEAGNYSEIKKMVLVK
ncbi:MAG: T9SS type A sorting domain-containing protein [Ignavibacteriae bacterium]|nr:T9SS type A sorting domain-containing protein [Ignavibacteriota bacterium]MCB9244667.1 T9SS type A sorting domain-containing protein [Ignavibacteriales bacterium]